MYVYQYIFVCVGPSVYRTCTVPTQTFPLQPFNLPAFHARWTFSPSTSLTHDCITTDALCTSAIRCPHKTLDGVTAIENSPALRYKVCHELARVSLRLFTTLEETVCARPALMDG